jgi:hypothetical protein
MVEAGAGEPYISSMERKLPTYLLGPDFDRKLTSFAAAFLSAGQEVFEKEFALVAPFVKQAQEDQSERDDHRLRGTPQEYYLLEALAYKIYDMENRERFNQTDKTLLVLPHCLTLDNPFCERVDLAHGDKCIGCKSDCTVNGIRELGEQYGAEVVFSKRALKEQISHYAELHKNLGVIGIGCLLMLAPGMRTAIDLDIPVRGIPLDYCGCDHWTEEPFATAFSIDRLKAMLEEKDAARRSTPDH